MLDITDFREPKEHPYGMLEGYGRAHEKEVLLRTMLKICLEQGRWVAVKTKYEHPAVVDDGLLEQTGEKEYRLTEKAKGLLYSVYHDET